MKALYLYIHIPFCRRKCSYCDFYSLPSENLIPAYIASLKDALHAHAEKLNQEYEVQSIYFGGGTPNILSAEQLNDILSEIRNAFRIAYNAEYTIEINPEFSHDPPSLRALRNIGFNRLSIGIQSFHDADLRVLGRLHTADTALRCLEHARKIFDNISLDLIYAVPGQSRSMMENNLKTALSFSPEHISAYNLTCEPGTPLAGSVENHAVILQDEERERSDFLFVHDYLTANGYEHYEISNYARPGFHSRHNSAYWSEKDYLGLGPSAHSRIGDRRFAYHADLNEFLRQPQDFHIHEPASEADILITRLRTSKGLPVNSLRPETWNNVLNYAEKHPGWFITDNSGIRCTPEGWLMLDSILEELV
ncbi:MAG: radical SAM family heme chaperone HemW [FCB group bacterium]|nr:radical SAM family heme chaperone HemW [FCB group bacterium]